MSKGRSTQLLEKKPFLSPSPPPLFAPDSAFVEMCFLEIFTTSQISKYLSNMFSGLESLGVVRRFCISVNTIDALVVCPSWNLSRT